MTMKKYAQVETLRMRSGSGEGKWGPAKAIITWAVLIASDLTRNRQFSVSAGYAGCEDVAKPAARRGRKAAGLLSSIKR